MLPSARSRPEASVTGRTKLVFSSIVTGADPASSFEWTAQPITVSSTVVRMPPWTAPSVL